MASRAESSGLGPWPLWWPGLAALYVLLVGKREPAEWLAGVAGAAVATFALGRVRTHCRPWFAPRPGWIARFGRLPGRVLAECGVVLGALVAALLGRGDVAGSVRAVPFDPGGRDGRSAARRALVIAGASLAPDGIVMEVDREHGRMLVHQLVPTPEPPGRGDREWPL